MEKRWELQKPDADLVKKFSKNLKCDPVIAAVLINRGIASESDARLFFKASPADIRSPFLLAEMDAAVERIHAALLHNEKILVFGDYDADGITATALLFEFLHLAGADVSCHIPHRTREGYGLQASHITGDSLAGDTKLIITADCGVAGYEAVESARAAGIDVIVTDHHIPPEKMPRALALINPNRPDCTVGLGMLAGVGVVFYLLMALRKYLRDRNFWKNRTEPNLKAMSDLVAIGTIADMVPLTGENRILSKVGLSVVNSGSRPGIKALMDVSGLTENGAEAEDIAFKLAPRLNAAGRLAHADAAYELLVTKNLKKAKGIARTLDGLNKRRRDIEKKILDEILDGFQKNPSLTRKRGIVLANRNWHEGVLGIVASRLVRRYNRPVILISLKDDAGKGSGRSVPGVDLFRVLAACSDDLDGFGGHAMAAGLRIHPDNISGFKKHFGSAVETMAGPEGSTIPLPIDCVLDFEAITDGIIEQLELIKPFGTGNPEPLFMARKVTVVSSKIVGGSHRRMRLTQTPDSSGKVFNAIQFNVETGGKQPSQFDRIAYRLRWNRWNGAQSPQLIVEAT